MLHGFGLFTDTGSAGSGLRVPLREVLRGYGLYPLLDHGIVPGAGVSDGVRASNTTKLRSLASYIVANGGGRILVSPLTFDFDATILSQSSGTQRSLWIEGTGYTSNLRFFGTSGVLLDWAGTAANPWYDSGMRNLTLTAASAMVSGSLIRLQTVNGFRLDDIRIPASAAAAGPWTAIQVGDPTLTTITTIPLNVYLNRVKTGLVSPSTGAAVLVYSAAGLYARQCDLSGTNTAAATSMGVRFLPNGTVPGNQFDTAILADCLIKDHKIGIRAGETGTTSNVQIIGGHLDGIGDGPDPGNYAADGVGIQLQGAAGTTVENVQCSVGWIASYATTNGYGVLIDTNGGTIRGIQVGGVGYITGCTKSSILVDGDPTDLEFEGIRIADASGNGTNVVDIGGTASGVDIHGVRVNGTATTGYAGEIGSGVTNFNVTGNRSDGGKTTGGWNNSAGTDVTTKIFANNSA